MIREWKEVTHFMNNGINIHKNSHKDCTHGAGTVAQQAKLLLGKADGSHLRVACQKSTYKGKEKTDSYWSLDIHKYTVASKG